MSVPSLPSVKIWLGQELELRGIDAMIYSHYILSILQQDNYEMDPEFDYMMCRKDPRSRFRGNKRGRYSWSSEDLKKTAVLQCLQSVTEQECGIEGLVEELCQKLQKLQDEQSKQENGNGNGKKTQIKKKENQKNSAKEENKAMKYFEAFPPLHTATHGGELNESFYKKNKKKKSPTFAEKLSKKDENLVKSKSASVSRHSSSPVQTSLQRPKSLPNVSTRTINRASSDYPKEHRQSTVKPRRKPRNDKNSSRESKTNKTSSPVKAERKQPKKVELLKQDVDTPYESDAEDVSWYVDPVMDVFTTTSEKSKFETVYRSEGTSPVMDVSPDDSTLEDAVSSITESLCKEIIDEMAMLDDLPVDVKQECPDMESFGDVLLNPGGKARNFKCNTLPRIGSKGFCDVPRPLSFIMDDSLSFIIPGSSSMDGEDGSGKDDNSSQMKELLGSKSHLADIWKSEEPKVTNPWNTDSNCETSLGDEKCVTSLRVFTGAHENVEEDARSNRSFASDSLSDSLLQICDHKHDHEHVKMSMALVACNPAHTQQHWSQADYSTNFMHYSSEDENGVAFVTHPTQDSYQATGGYQHVQQPGRDVNNALWSTYDMQESCVPPPKIVTWDCSQQGVGLSKFMKKAKFIEGGVYGSPYSSHNNSQLNSVCSSRTESPYDDSLRDLWETPFNEEAQLDSKLLHHAVITRQHISQLQLQRKPSSVSSISSSRRNSALDYNSDTGAFCDDAGIDSPVFVSSRRNSSRFDFARCVGFVEDDGNSELHPGDSHQELFDEVMKETEDILELTQSLKTACTVKSESNEQVSFEQEIKDVEETEYDFIPWCPSTTPKTESASDSESLCGSLTTIKPAITKPEPIRNLKSQPIGFGSSYDKHRSTMSPHEQSRREIEDLLISPKTHFRPIRESFSSEDSPVARDENFNSEQYIAADKGSTLVQSYEGLQFSTSTPSRSTANEHRLSMDCTKRYLEKIGKWDLSEAGYLSDGNQPRTLYPKKQSRYFPKEQTKEFDNISASFPTNFLQRTPPYLTGAEYMSEVFDVQKEDQKDLPCLCGKSSTEGPVNVVDIGQPCPRHARWFQTCAGGGEDSDSATYGFSTANEYDPTVNMDYDQQIFPYEDDVFVPPHMEENKMPKKVVFSCDLEEKWLQESEQATNGHGYKKKLKTKNRLQPKPCSFFLEGKCRKLDCRFSHDLSTITCRFWEESTCFKGDDCPFLHDYPSEQACNVSGEADKYVTAPKSYPVKETPTHPIPTLKNESSLIKKGIFAWRKKPKLIRSSSHGNSSARQSRTSSSLSSSSKMATSSSRPIPVVKATERSNFKSLPINIKAKPR